MRIGDVVTDSASGSVRVGTIFGEQTVNATVEAEVTYLEYLPFVDTPLGRFFNVLHVRLEISGTAFSQTIEIRNLELFLKAGVGMIKQDQDADPNDAENQVIDRGKIGGEDLRNEVSSWELYE